MSETRTTLATVDSVDVVADAEYVISMNDFVEKFAARCNKLAEAASARASAPGADANTLDVAKRAQMQAQYVSRELLTYQRVKREIVSAADLWTVASSIFEAKALLLMLDGMEKQMETRSTAAKANKSTQAWVDRVQASPAADAASASPISSDDDDGVDQDDSLPPFHRYAVRNDLDGMQRCIDAGAKVDQRASDEATPFLSATVAGSWEAAEFLLDRGADINAVCEDAGCALSDAISQGNMGRLQWLLSRGAHPELNMGDYNPLYEAIRAGRADMVRALLAHGAEPNPRLRADGPSKKPLDLARELLYFPCADAIREAIARGRR
jgi:hypothetical protein